MAEEVIVKIRGLQMMDQDSDTIETISPGNYYLKNGKHYILYDEVTEGVEEPTHNRIKIQPGYMELLKKGITNVHMVFEEGKKNQTYYYTPFGSLLIGIDARMVKISENAETISAEVEYALEINNEFVADCHIFIEVSFNKKVVL